MSNSPAAVLRQARARDSSTKRDRAVAAVRHLHGSGHRVTFAHVARHARVSTWFTYNQSEVRAAIEMAMADQLENGVTDAATPARERVGAAGLQTELELTRHELTQTRRDRDRLRARVQLALGAELDEVTRNQLVERIAKLERSHDEHLQVAREAQQTIEVLQTRLLVAQDELVAARTSLRRVIKSENLR